MDDIFKGMAKRESYAQIKQRFANDPQAEDLMFRDIPARADSQVETAV